MDRATITQSRRHVIASGNAHLRKIKPVTETTITKRRRPTATFTFAHGQMKANKTY